MKSIFPLFVILCLLSGCITTPRPTTGSVSYSHLAQTEAPETDSEAEGEEKPEPKVKDTSGMPSGPVVVLLGIGAAFMLMSIGAMNYDDGEPEFAAITGGTGLILWGAAGIVAATE